jgi:hypothetical protein
MSAYRHAARREGDEAVDEGPLFGFDASAAAGADGADGASGRDGTFSGDTGEAGQNAGAPTPGGAGGNLVVELVPAGETLVEATALVGTSRGRTTDRATADFSRPASIVLLSRGGRGGRGGDGGDGGAGARGRSGSDATRYSSGGNGGPGGDGGAAGAGSSGAHGGDGGTIVVRTRAEDTHLLMLVEASVDGGSGGKQGKNGSPGAGGSGGSGGSSYTWTETDSYTDSNGQQQTRTTSHSNSAGSRGFDGRDGAHADGSPKPGPRGRAGRFTIEVNENGASRSYSSRYDLRLVSFAHRNENDGGVYEPGEKAYIGGITVENTGGMPLPSHHDVHIGLTRGAWAYPVEDERGRPLTLKVPRGLAAGARHVFREELPLVLGTHRPDGATGPLSAPETLRLEATLPAARRSFVDFDAGAAEENGKIVVRHPLEIAPIVGLASLAAGQVTRVVVTLRNVSNKTIGVNGEVPRAVALRWSLGYGELGAGDAHLFDQGLARIDLSSEHSRPMPYVPSDGESTLEMRLGISETAAPYTSARLVVTCDLAPPDGQGLPRAIHIRDLVVRVGRPFVAGDADVLLLVNHRTTPEELAVWESHVAAAFATSATWDVSLEDGVAVLESIANGDRHFGTVVLLNNAVGTTEEESRPASLVPKALAHALARVGTRVLTVGKTKTLETWLVPTGAEDGASMAHGADTKAKVEALLALEPGVGHVRLDVESMYVWPWSTESAQHLEKQALRWARTLERAYPSRRYVVIARYAPRGTRKSAWIRHVASGSLEIRRTLDAGALANRSFSLDDASLHTARTLNDSRVFFVLLCTFSFEAKLRLLVSGTMPCEDHKDALVLAILVDLLAEQAPREAHSWGAGDLGKPGSLPRLEALGRALGSFSSTLALARIGHLVSWLSLVARGRVRFWEWLPPFLWIRRSHALRSRVRAFVADANTAFPRERERFEQATALLRETFDAERRDNGTNAKTFASNVLSNQGISLAPKTDADALGPGTRVLAAEELDRLTALDQTRATAARASSAQAARARSDLRISDSCNELLRRSSENVGIRIAEDAEATTDFGDLRESNPDFGLERS